MSDTREQILWTTRKRDVIRSQISRILRTHKDLPPEIKVLLNLEVEVENELYALLPADSDTAAVQS